MMVVWKTARIERSDPREGECGVSITKSILQYINNGWFEQESPQSHTHLQAASSKIPRGLFPLQSQLPKTTETTSALQTIPDQYPILTLSPIQKWLPPQQIYQSPTSHSPE